MPAITGKSRGLKVGDLVSTGVFPGVIISDVGTTAPCCEVFGIEQECGSAYAEDIVKITVEEFIARAASYGHTEPFRVYGKATLSSLLAAGLKAELAS